METPRRVFLMHYKIFCLIAVLFFTINHSVSAEEIPDRIDGAVVSIDEKNRILKVDFEHPATFERSKLEFQIAENAGFKDFKRLRDLKKGDLISLDYMDYGKTLKAIYIIRIPQEKTYFTPQEIAGALVKIKGNQKKNEPQEN